MNLEHMEAVKARIEDIRRRFVDPMQADTPVNRISSGPQPSVSFDEALRKASKVPTATCPSELEPMIARAAEKYGVDPSVVKALIKSESGFRQSAVSRVGAIGLTQLMPGTARALGVDPNNAEENIDGGVRYLKQQMDRFGSLESALAAYNAGPGAVVKYGGVPPYRETQDYVRKVLENVSAFSNE